MTGMIEAMQMYSKMHRLFQDSMLFLHCVSKNAFQNGTTNTREWRRRSCTSAWYSKRQNFRINPYFTMHILVLKENNSEINRLPLGLYLRFVLKDSRQNNVASPGPNRAVSPFGRRLYGNRKSPLSCRSYGSLQNIFETIGAIGTIKWKPGLRDIQFLDHKRYGNKCTILQLRNIYRIF